MSQEVAEYQYGKIWAFGRLVSVGNQQAFKQSIGNIRAWTLYRDNAYEILVARLFGICLQILSIWSSRLNSLCSADSFWWFLFVDVCFNTSQFSVLDFISSFYWCSCISSHSYSRCDIYVFLFSKCKPQIILMTWWHIFVTGLVWLVAVPQCYLEPTSCCPRVLHFVSTNIFPLWKFIYPCNEKESQIRERVSGIGSEWERMNVRVRVRINLSVFLFVCLSLCWFSH